MCPFISMCCPSLPGWVGSVSNRARLRSRLRDIASSSFVSSSSSLVIDLPLALKPLSSREPEAGPDVSLKVGGEGDRRLRMPRVRGVRGVIVVPDVMLAGVVSAVAPLTLGWLTLPSQWNVGMMAPGGGA